MFQTERRLITSFPFYAKIMMTILFNLGSTMSTVAVKSARRMESVNIFLARVTANAKRR